MENLIEAHVADGWVICPFCFSKQFPVDGTETIKKLKYRCRKSTKANEHSMIINYIGEKNMLNKRKSYSDGKIIVTDFKKVEPCIFYPIYSYTREELSKEFMLCTSNGRWFINNRIPGHEFLLSVVQILVSESRYALENYRQTYKGQFKEITFENWMDMPGDNAQKTIALALLIIPGEIKRRELEKAYYTKQKVVKMRKL